MTDAVAPAAPTPAMIEAAATVIMERCGESRSTMNWAREVAETVLTAALQLPNQEAELAPKTVA